MGNHPASFKYKESDVGLTLHESKHAMYKKGGDPDRIVTLNLGEGRQEKVKFGSMFYMDTQTDGIYYFLDKRVHNARFTN